MRSQRVAIVLGLTLVIAATVAAPAASEPQAAAGNLDFRVKLRLISSPLILPCTGPPVSPPFAGTACIARLGTGFVRGLGNVSVSYTWLLGVGPPACPAGFAKPLATTGLIGVARKGQLTFQLRDGALCMTFADLLKRDLAYEQQEFTIAGGTGSFFGASGNGKVGRPFPGLPGPEKTELWTGTLKVPGLKFDLKAPKLHGAGSRTVRAQNGAKSARVTFKLTATDGVDRAVPVSCRPRSGSRFRIGKTRVDCSATDSSGNTAKAAFTVTVRR